MQKVIVVNRETAVELTNCDSSLDRVIISISSSMSDEPPFNRNNHAIHEILYLFFDDEEIGPNAITEHDAKGIAKFSQKWWDSIDQIVVHCDAGVSRSAGVAAAILKHFTDNDTQIFNDVRYCPNITCYRKVLNALNEE